MVSKQFKEMVQMGQFVVLDTETTGLHDGEICQIAIVSAAGDVLLNTLVKTCYPIPTGATAIHGITDDMVADAPSWSQLLPVVRTIIEGKDVVIYNAVYDRKMMHQSNEKSGLEKIDWKQISTFWCAMEEFAVVYGEFNDWHGTYRWQKLSTAASYYKLDSTGAHDALADCVMTLGVVRGMCSDDK